MRTFRPPFHDNAVTVDAEGETTWRDYVDPALDGEQDTYDTDELRLSPRAPKWVQDWSGPFYVSVQVDHEAGCPATDGMGCRCGEVHEVTGQPYVIRAKTIVDSLTDEPLYWSGNDGWGDRASAQEYSLADTKRLHLPTDGEWVEVLFERDVASEIMGQLDLSDEQWDGMGESGRASLIARYRELNGVETKAGEG